MSLIEELEAKLEKATGNEKLELLNSLSREYSLKVFTDKGIDYGLKALAMSKDLNNQKQEALALRNIGIGYGTKGDYRTALRYYFESLELSKQIRYMDGIASSYNNIAVNYSYLGRNDKAMDYYEKALAIFKEMDLRDGEAICYINMGELYKDRGDLENSLRYELKALHIAEELGQADIILEPIIVIGDIYMIWQHFDKAMQYYDKALTLIDEIGQKDRKAYVLIQLGKNHLNEGHLLKAMEILESARALSESYGKKEDLADARLTMGQVFARLEDCDRATKLYQEALAVYEESGSMEGMQRALCCLALIHKRNGNFSAALELLEKALLFAAEADIRYEVMEIYRLLSEIYADMQDYRNALNYHRLHSCLKDLILTTQGHRIAEIQTRMEVEAKEKESEIYRLKNVELAQANQRLHESFQRIEKAQEEIIQLERKGSILAMAVTANHEINQPLMIIQGNLELLSIELNDSVLSPKQREYLNRVLQAVDRIHKILERFKSSETISIGAYCGDQQMVVFDHNDGDSINE